MSNLATISSTFATMSSREIAELTEKQHAHVMRDIRAMTERLSADPNLDWHCETETYIDEQGKPRDMYRMDKDTTLTLVSGYDAVLRFRIIKRWQELEEQTFAQPPKLSREDRYRLGVYRDAYKTAKLIGFEGNMTHLTTEPARNILWAPSILAVPALNGGIFVSVPLNGAGCRVSARTRAVVGR